MMEVTGNATVFLVKCCGILKLMLNTAYFSLGLKVEAGRKY